MKYGDFLLTLDDEYFYATFFGIGLMVFLGWFPLIGPIISGFVAGIVMGYPLKGIKIGIIIGAVGSLLINFVFNFVFGSISIAITPHNPTGLILSALFNHAKTFGPYTLIILAIFFAAIGGAIGGAVAERISKQSYERGKQMEKAVKIIKNLEK